MFDVCTRVHTDRLVWGIAIVDTLSFEVMSRNPL